jgi:hypothetical protein
MTLLCRSKLWRHFYDFNDRKFVYSTAHWHVGHSRLAVLMLMPKQPLVSFQDIMATYPLNN